MSKDTPLHSFMFGQYIVDVTNNHATISTNDGVEPQPTFYEMQCMKSQAFGGAATVVEVFPANKHLIDGQHQRHLWEVDPNGVPNLNTGHLVEVDLICPDRTPQKPDTPVPQEPDDRQPQLAARFERMITAFDMIKADICKCSWNPNSHAADCPVALMETAIYSRS